MEEICRLCCSNRFVNNYIFDEENALYLKMSLYLPIKVFKNDRLPQKICDRCSCKVNDFYQFCNETIEVQNRLRAVLISTAVEIQESVDLTHFPPSPLPIHKIEATELCITNKLPTISIKNDIQNENRNETSIKTELSKITSDQSTQTETNLEPAPSDIYINVPLYHNMHIKQEPIPSENHQNVKTEDTGADDFWNSNLPSDNSEDDVSLIQFKKKKTKNKKAKVSNGNIEKKKHKKNLKEWEILMRALPEGTALTVVDPAQPDVKVKQELVDLGLEAAKEVKLEPEEYHCCICYVTCYSRVEMLQHYKDHETSAEQKVAPPAPPPPDTDPAKCARCQKRVEKDLWTSHWQKHWERDLRPFRCAVCEKGFRNPHQILKHGLTHKWGEMPLDPSAGPEKRFICDLCPEGFVYMRYLLSHRARAHPEAATRALTLRCAVCSRQFAHLNSLRRHLRAHTGERNFLCNICGKALSSREHLKFHIRIHTGYKPNICKTCGKGFVKKCNLTLHERVHSGERPHVCPHCGKAFSQRSTLVIHERYHSGARPYVCTLCNRGFVAKGLLSMHLKNTCI